MSTRDEFLQRIVVDGACPTELRVRALDWWVGCGSTPVHTNVNPSRTDTPHCEHSDRMDGSPPPTLPDELDDLKANGGVPPILGMHSTEFFSPMAYGPPLGGPPDDVIIGSPQEGSTL